ncbi:hypothetical protein FLA_5671 [Filimonas lacunae]|nr:hypothetical protein FLA_5671 [Filimonas lacunae]
MQPVHIALCNYKCNLIYVLPERPLTLINLIPRMLNNEAN